MSTPTLEPRYKLIFTVPHSSLEACKSAVFAKGEHPAYSRAGKKKKEYPAIHLFLPSFFCHILYRIPFAHGTDPGAGSYPGGKYSMVCFEVPGTGQFLPGEGAVPNLGAVGKLERVPETRVEVLCVGTDVMTGAVDSLKR